MDSWARSWETHFQLTEDKEPSLPCGSFCLELIQACFIRTFQQESKKETVKIENDQSFESSYHKWYSFTLSYFALLKASQWIHPTQRPCRESWMSLRIWGAVCNSDVHLIWFGETCLAIPFWGWIVFARDDDEQQYLLWGATSSFGKPRRFIPLEYKFYRRSVVLHIPNVMTV